jgi:hypothetical protein
MTAVATIIREAVSQRAALISRLSKSAIEPFSL